MVNKTENNITLGHFSIMVIETGLFFYYILLYKLVWNWFIGDYIITVDYMEMLFIAIALKFITGIKGNTRNTRIIDENFGRPSSSEKLGTLIGIFIAKNIMFAFLFVVYLAKANYYG